MEISRSWWDEFTIKHAGRELSSIDRDELKELHRQIAEELGLDCIEEAK